MSQRIDDAGQLEAADHCIGCGQRPEELQPIEAVTLLRLLQRRSSNLARRGRLDAPHSANHPFAPSSSAAVAAARIPAVLASADRRLRRLFAEPEPLAIVRPGPGGGSETATVTFTLASVAEVAERLVRTIACATSEDWYHRRPSHDVSAAEITWLALHDATHSLEDVELAVAQGFAAPPANTTTSGDQAPVADQSAPNEPVVATNLVLLNRATHPSSQSQRYRPGMPRGGISDDAS